MSESKVFHEVRKNIKPKVRGRNVEANSAPSSATMPFQLYDSFLSGLAEELWLKFSLFLQVEGNCDSRPGVFSHSIEVEAVGVVKNIVNFLGSFCAIVVPEINSTTLSDILKHQRVHVDWHDRKSVRLPVSLILDRIVANVRGPRFFL